MASLVAGAVCGVHKEAQIIPVKIADSQGQPRTNYLVRAMQGIIRVQYDTGNPAAVASMSFNFLLTDFVDPVLTVPHVLTPLMQRLSVANVFITMSAGNDPNAVIDDYIPQSLGGISTPYMVVGAADQNGQRDWYSQYLETGSKSILSLYAMGHQVLRANLDPNLPYSYSDGTSPANAIVAGIAAKLIASGVSVPNIKNRLRSDGFSLKGTNFPADVQYVVPRAGISAQVSCSSPVLSAAAPTPTYTEFVDYFFSLTATPSFQKPSETPVSCYTFTSQTSRTNMLVVTGLPSNLG
jgi:hypothetical protein